MHTHETLTIVVGLGRSGVSVARFLHRRGEAMMVVDSRAQPPGLEAVRALEPAVAIQLGEFDAGLFAGARRLVVSPGVAVSHPAIAAAMDRDVPVLGDIELFAVHNHAPVVAVTGSNGKSTVVTLLGLMAEADGRRVAVGGNIGTPALDLLQGDEPELCVLELSSFQLETTHSLNARVASILNISPDHMDRYPDVAGYGAAKQRIFMGDGVMVLNRDDAVVAAMQRPDRRCISFGLDAPSAGHYGCRVQQGREWLARGEELLLPTPDLRTPGRHNLANALAALAMGESVGLGRSAMLTALRTFTGLPHRCEWVTEQDGVRWINDSKGTNVGATVAAIEGLRGDGDLVLIAGGDGKGADFGPLAEALNQGVRGLVLIGRDAQRIADAVEVGLPTVMAGSMSAAVRAARGLAEAGDTVLLSPACASFDMFKGFEDRGRSFVAAVHEGACP